MYIYVPTCMYYVLDQIQLCVLEEIVVKCIQTVQTIRLKHKNSPTLVFIKS